MATMGKVLSFSIITLLLVSVAMIIVPFAYSQKPVINSQWTDNPPNIDGKFTDGEWSNLQITFKSPEYPADYVLPTYAYFLNDGSNLYVLVDAVGDTTDAIQDECLLIFDNNSDPTDGFTVVRIVGDSNTWTKSSDNFDAAIGYDGSPNSPNTHKIYEFAIPFTFINTQPDQSFDFCSPFYKSPLPAGSMSFDSATNYDNIWPQGLGKDTTGWQQTADGWGIMNTKLIAPVGGHFVPINKLAILSPYLALVALIGAVISIAIRRTRK
ncbi:hypothetical protein ACFLQ6_06515 [Thermoproteota archaeon]